MKKIDFKTGIQISPAKVVIDGTEYEITPAVWSGTTPLSAQVLNMLQNNIEAECGTYKSTTLTTTTPIAENTNYTIPVYYKVGSNTLDIYYMGEKLVKNEHYIEVGETGAVSNIIQFKDWGQSVPKDRIIEFVVKGEYSSES